MNKDGRGTANRTPSTTSQALCATTTLFPDNRVPECRVPETGATGGSRTHQERICRPLPNRLASVANWSRWVESNHRSRITGAAHCHCATPAGARVGDRTRVTELATPCLTIRPLPRSEHRDSNPVIQLGRLTLNHRSNKDPCPQNQKGHPAFARWPLRSRNPIRCSPSRHPCASLESGNRTALS